MEGRSPMRMILRPAAVSLLVLTLGVAPAAPASATRSDRVIVLPGASSAEGITAGRGSTFYAGDLFRGGGAGTAYVYDTRRRTTAATYQFGDPNASFVNDVTLARGGAWFTDSL